MKIALICTEKLPVPPIAGGAVQLYIEGIVPYLSGIHDITVFSIQYPGLPDIEVKNNVKYVRVPGGSSKIYVNSLRTALDSSYDLIHVLNRPRYVLELMDYFPDVKFSLSLHNEMFHPEKLSDEEGIKCINRVEFINTVSKYISDTVANRFPIAKNKLHVVYSGVDTSLYQPVWSYEGQQLKKKYKAMFGLQDYKVVLFVGRLSVKKGVDVLLKAMDIVMRTNPKTALVVIGSKWYGKNESDDYTASLKKMSEAITGRIVFTGFVPPAEIAKMYAMGDVFVCASQWNEPLARVHYEAMAAGLPIITTNRGGNAEVIRGYGNGIVLDDYSNPSSMAYHISELLKNEAVCLKMGKIGRRLAEEKYSWKSVADEVFEMLPSGSKAGASGQAKAGISGQIKASASVQAKALPDEKPSSKPNIKEFDIAIPATELASDTPKASKAEPNTAAQSAVLSKDQSAVSSIASDKTQTEIKQKPAPQSVPAKAPSLASFMQKPKVSAGQVQGTNVASSAPSQGNFWLSGEVKAPDVQKVTQNDAVTLQPQTDAKQKQKPQKCSLADFTSGRFWNKSFK